MKNQFRILVLISMAISFATGCGKDQIDFPPTPEPDKEIGYLVISGMNIGVSSEVETLETGNKNSVVAQTAGNLISRVPEDADGTYNVSITNNATQASAWSGTYTDLKAIGKPLELTPGRYTIKAQSPGTIEPIAWEKPTYAGSTEFTIVKKVNTTVTDLVCTLSNIKTSVELSADLKALFLNDGTDDLKTTVSLGDTSTEFSRDESRAAYYQAVATSNQLIVTLTGLYNVKGEGQTPEYKPVSMTQTIPNVKAGQWRKIAIMIEHADDGNVKFIITVETWVYDEKINVDVMSQQYTFGEDEIPDEDKEVSAPGSPVLMLDGGHNIANPFRITSSIFDFDFEPVRCKDIISIIATPEGSSTITDAYCIFNSDNAAFLTALKEAGYTDHKVTIWPTNGASNYLISRVDASNRLLVKVNDAGMYGLYGYEGTHTVKIVMTDNQKRRSYTLLTISVSKGGSTTGPTITGQKGYNIDNRYTISPADNPPLQVAVEVTSTSGITGFKIQINGGNVLGDKDLIGLDLAPEMDLLNPATPEMRNQLANLGFLPKDGSSIEGKTSMTFNISEFIPAMTSLSGTGNCDFKLTVTDAAGTKEKTLMFNVIH